MRNLSFKMYRTLKLNHNRTNFIPNKNFKNFKINTNKKNRNAMQKNNKNSKINKNK